MPRAGPRSSSSSARTIRCTAAGSAPAPATEGDERRPLMAHDLQQFAAECRRLLTEEPGPAGRKKVCDLLQEVLKDEAFIAKHVSDDVPERKILYEDPSLGFCILAHNYSGAKESPPHDHGPSWAIYGQARG